MAAYSEGFILRFMQAALKKKSISGLRAADIVQFFFITSALLVIRI